MWCPPAFSSLTWTQTFVSAFLTTRPRATCLTSPSICRHYITCSTHRPSPRTPEMRPSSIWRMVGWSDSYFLTQPLQWRHNERDGFQITSVTIVYSTICSGVDQRKHQSSASLVFVRGIHRWPVNSPHKGPVTPKIFQFDDVIMKSERCHVVFFQCWCVSMLTCKRMGPLRCSAGIHNPASGKYS